MRFIIDLLRKSITNPQSHVIDFALQNQLGADENKIILADAAYDSSILRNKVEDLKLGKLLSCKNIRNSKIPLFASKTRK